MNTYKEIEHLIKLGATPELAQGIVELHTKSDEHLATKNDIVILESKIENLGIKLESKIDGVATRLESSIRELKNDNSWIKTIAIAIFSAIAGAIIANYIFK